MSEQWAWNNFVMRDQPANHAQGSDLRAAAVANVFSSLAGNGGLNGFLTSSYDLDASEVVEALLAIGAPKAAHQLGAVLRGLGRRLPVCSQDERWTLLERHWTDELDEIETLSEEAAEELTRALDQHVSRHEAFYRALG